MVAQQFSGSLQQKAAEWAAERQALLARQRDLEAALHASEWNDSDDGDSRGEPQKPPLAAAPDGFGNRRVGGTVRTTSTTTAMTRIHTGVQTDLPRRHAWTQTAVSGDANERRSISPNRDLLGSTLSLVGVDAASTSLGAAYVLLMCVCASVRACAFVGVFASGGATCEWACTAEYG
jgi:hypothetical protein